MTTIAYLLAARTLGLPSSQTVGACECTSCSGSAVGGFTVTSSEIEDLDANIRNLNADINAQTNFAESASVNRFLDWQAFFVRWGGWRENHTTVLEQSAVPLLGEPNVGPEFEAFVSEYNERLRAFKQGGGQTSAPKNTSTETALDKVVKYAVPIAVIGGIGFLVVETGLLKDVFRRR